MVTYLVAPPAPKEQLEKIKHANDSMTLGEDEDDEVDMRPWFYTKMLLAACVAGRFVLLAGRLIELHMGERMFFTNA